MVHIRSCNWLTKSRPNDLLLSKISTGLPPHGQPLNCQAGPWTNTATTLSLNKTHMINTLMTTVWFLHSSLLTMFEAISPSWFPPLTCKTRLKLVSELRGKVTCSLTSPRGWVWVGCQWPCKALSIPQLSASAAGLHCHAVSLDFSSVPCWQTFHTQDFEGRSCYIW